jgi:mRNA-degrading endonuclease toxin of MazEF toxin-antitoxin module
MVEQLAAVDWGRLGEPVERLTFAEMQDIDQALDLVIGRT